MNNEMNKYRYDLKGLWLDVLPYVLMALALMIAVTVLFDIAFGADFCFPSETTNNMVVELEQCRIQKEELAICNEAVFNLEQTVTTYSDEVDVCKGSLADARKAFDDNKKLQEEQNKNYEEQLKKSQPSFFQRIINNVALVGGGIAVGIVAGILLRR